MRRRRSRVLDRRRGAQAHWGLQTIAWRLQKPSEFYWGARRDRERFASTASSSPCSSSSSSSSSTGVLVGWPAKKRATRRVLFLALGMADQYVAVKKPAGYIPLPYSIYTPLGPLSDPVPSPRDPREKDREERRRTNDQRNVNRKPHEATLINPTEINCIARRRVVHLPLNTPSILPDFGGTSPRLSLTSSTHSNILVRSTSLLSRDFVCFSVLFSRFTLFHSIDV